MTEKSNMGDWKLEDNVNELILKSLLSTHENLQFDNDRFHWGRLANQYYQLIKKLSGNYSESTL